MKHIVFFDGCCVLCSRCIRFIAAHDTERTFLFSSLQGRYAERIISKNPALIGIDSVVLCTIDHNGKESFLLKSDAVIGIACRLGGAWTMVSIAAVVPKRIRDYVYDRIARHRYAMFGRYESCTVADAGIQSQTID